MSKTNNQVPTKKLVQQILNSPESAIEQFDLVYAGEDDFPILRKRRGKGFIYHMEGKALKEKKDLSRIKNLVIPPMWEKVKITHLENGHLQAFGRDARNRKQYLYHPHWSMIRNATKFYKMYDFGNKLPLIRKQVEKDLQKKGWPLEKVIALVISIMEETHIRIGNHQYAKSNSTYGLTTLRKKHVDIQKNNLQIDYIGKRGKKHSVSLQNRKLINLIRLCEELPGWELFKYYDNNGERHSLESNHVNEYLHQICGEFFTAKDFRTWAASLSFFEALMQMEKPENKTNIQKNILDAFDAAAAALGNTRAVCRKYYVHPKLPAAYEDGTLYKAFNKVVNGDEIYEYFSASEKEMLKLIKSYTPEFTLLQG